MVARMGIERLHRVGMHGRSKEGVESGRAGGLHLPAKKHTLARQPKRRFGENRKTRCRERRRRGRAEPRLARRAAYEVRVRQKLVRTLAAKGANGYGRDSRVCCTRRCNSASLWWECRRWEGRTEFVAAGFRVFCHESESSGTYGVGSAVEERIRCNSNTVEYGTNDGPMAMRFERPSDKSGAVML